MASLGAQCQSRPIPHLAEEGQRAPCSVPTSHRAKAGKKGALALVTTPTQSLGPSAPLGDDSMDSGAA